MIDPEILKSEIRSAFGDVKFPKHCGIRAARLKDDWVNDKDILKKATKENDYSGHWWDVPEEYIFNESLGFNYLDAEGVEFYLPAFMTFVINNPSQNNFRLLEFELSPVKEVDNETKEILYKYFCDKFSKITNSKKDVTIKFIKFLIQEIKALAEINSDTNMNSEKLEKALSHEYWQQ